MNKAVRNKPLTFVQHILNRFISSVRYKVERSIGTLKRVYHFTGMRYTGLKKGNMEFFLNTTVFNLKKVAGMVSNRKDPH
jgi:IS5 family transposase